jgi:hypothetical protein
LSSALTSRFLCARHQKRATVTICIIEHGNLLVVNCVYINIVNSCYLRQDLKKYKHLWFTWTFLQQIPAVNHHTLISPIPVYITGRTSSWDFLRLASDQLIINAKLSLLLTSHSILTLTVLIGIFDQCLFILISLLNTCEPIQALATFAALSSTSNLLLSHVTLRVLITTTTMANVLCGHLWPVCAVASTQQVSCKHYLIT